MDEIVFFMLRHISSDEFHKVWKLSYESIRKFYPEAPIYILDNNSPEHYLTEPYPFYKCEVIRSELPNGRLYVPFYYALQIPNYKRAVLLHDGIVFQSYVDFSTVENVSFLWHFETHAYDDVRLCEMMLQTLPSETQKNILSVYKSNNWFGSLGCMMVLERDFLNELETQFALRSFQTIITDKPKAIEFERLIAVLCYMVYPELHKRPSLFGDISTMIWGLRYSHYISNITAYSNQSVIKLFGAR